MFQINRRTLYIAVIVAFGLLFLTTAKLPYYIYKPGTADGLSEMVEVDLGHESKGEFHLVTVSGGQATPIELLLAKISSYHEILPLDEAFPEDFTEEEYRFYQMKMMEDSKTSSMVVAYEAAGEPIDIKLTGVFVVQTIDQMPAKDQVQIGDRIIAIDDVEVKEPKDLVDYVQEKEIDERVILTIEREEEVLKEEIPIRHFPDHKDKKGLGIQLIADQVADPKRPVEIQSGHIGGPSAGIMFALEIHNQIVEEDITKGYAIAGTGEIDIDGKVLRVGGVDKKVIAADRKNIDIFFVPHEQGHQNSNYRLAKQTARAIETEMQIVPIDSFQDALDYLEQLERKHN